jgi:iron complex outermembrane receptor protein
MDMQHRRDPAMQRRPLARAIATTLVLALAGPAFAQEAQPGQAAASQNTTSQNVTTLDNMVVTANKREENIREVAAAITVLGGQQLENFSATQMSDYASYVPGLQLQSNGTPGQTQVSMRGIAAMSPGSTIGTYLDETPVGSNSLYQQATLFSLDLFPYDIDRIEVLRGPQGTLYGAGAMGGLLKYMTRRPDPTQTEFRIGGGVSDTEGAGDLGYNYRVGANVPLVDEKLALRVSYARNDIAGYVDNLVDGRKDINEGEQTSARAALAWESDVVDLQFAVMQQKIDSENNGTVALDPETHEPIAGLSNYIYENEPFIKDLDHYSLTVDWDLGFADFVSATSYSDTHTVITSDQTLTYGPFTALFGLPPGRASLTYALDLNQLTQEFRLTSKAGRPFEWLVGVFYSDEDGDNSQTVPIMQFDGSPIPGLSTLGDLAIPSTYEETAVFANGSYKFNDWFKLGAGVRFSRNEQDFAQIVSDGVLLPIGTNVNSSSEDVVTWSVTPQFQLNEDVMLYAKAATGYQPGGPNVLAPGLPPVVDSSMLTSYEIGMKSAFADHRVVLDLTAYQIDWEDIQVASQVNGISGLVNGGEATSRGIEASALFRPIDGLTLGLNAAYNDANIDEDFPPIIVPTETPIGPAQVEVNTGLKDDRMPYVPDLTWSITADWVVPLGGNWTANFGGGVRWVDDRTNGTTERQVVRLLDPPTVLDEEVTEPLVIDSYYAVDLYAAFSNENWTLRAYMKNATDERAYSTMNDVVDQVTGVTHHTAASPIQPRTFGVEVDYRF